VALTGAARRSARVAGKSISTRHRVPTARLGSNSIDRTTPVQQETRPTLSSAKSVIADFSRIEIRQRSTSISFSLRR
jgi:hypothetical protein